MPQRANATSTTLYAGTVRAHARKKTKAKIMHAHNDIDPGDIAMAIEVWENEGGAPGIERRPGIEQRPGIARRSRRSVAASPAANAALGTAHLL